MFVQAEMEVSNVVDGFIAAGDPAEARAFVIGCQHELSNSAVDRLLSRIPRVPTRQLDRMRMKMHVRKGRHAEARLIARSLYPDKPRVCSLLIDRIDAAERRYIEVWRETYFDDLPYPD